MLNEICGDKFRYLCLAVPLGSQMLGAILDKYRCKLSCCVFVVSYNMLQFLDILFTVLHLLIIGFNLTGWIWVKTRIYHFYGILLTAFSWFVLGIWYGFGYCPITDWQWQVKEKLGERNLPNSFIKYFVDQVTGESINANLVDVLTALCFLLAAGLSVYFNFIKKTG